MRLTAEERLARGRAARNECPRSSHGRWVPMANRPDPIALLEEQGVTRVPGEMRRRPLWSRQLPDPPTLIGAWRSLQVGRQPRAGNA